jgi:hypothetical protein
MKMLSQNWLYMGTGIGMMIKSRIVSLHRVLKIFAWLKVFEELVSYESIIEICNFLRSMPSDLISNKRKKLRDKFTILFSHPLELKRSKSKRS